MTKSPGPLIKSPLALLISKKVLVVATICYNPHDFLSNPISSRWSPIIFLRIRTFFDPHIFGSARHINAPVRPQVWCSSVPCGSPLVSCCGLCRRPCWRWRRRFAAGTATKIDADEMGMDCYHCESIGIHRLLLQYITMIIGKWTSYHIFSCFLLYNRTWDNWIP